MTQINNSSEDYPLLSAQPLHTPVGPAKKVFNFLSHRPLPIHKAFFMLLCLLASATAFAQVIFIKAPSTTTIASSAKPSIAGQPVILSATVTSPSAVSPTGAVHFFDATNTDLTPAGVALLNGVATFKTAVLSNNTSFTATYSGDANILPSTSVVYDQTVNQQYIIISVPFYQTTTTLVSNSNPSVAGAPVTFTATVGFSGAALTGVVEFWDNTNNKNLTPGGIAVSNGVAKFTAASLPFGDLNITAVYRGDANGNQQSISSSLIQHVLLNITGIGVTVTSSSSGNTSNWGDLVTFKATVSTGFGGAAGTVIFTDNGNLLGSATTNFSGVASLSTSILAPGNHNITASYFSKTSSVLTQTVKSPYSPTTVSIGIPNLTKEGIFHDLARNFYLNGQTNLLIEHAKYGQAVTFVAIVSGATGYTPTGSVTFFNGTTELGTAALDAGGYATFTTSMLPPGDHDISMYYNGDDIYANQAFINNYLSKQSPSIHLIVDRSPTRMSISSSLNPSVAGQQQISFTSIVTPRLPSGGGNPLTGTVAFTIDGVAQNPVPVTPQTGKAVFTTSSIAPGSHNIRANYSGDINYEDESSSGSITQVVEPVGTAFFYFLGDAQSTGINTVFPSSIMFDILSLNSKLAGAATVTYSAPSAGASGTFSNGTNTITVKTSPLGSIGEANSGPFKANAIAGTYTVTATVPGMGTATFTMTNTVPPVQITVGGSLPGISFTVDGVTYASSQTFSWAPGSKHSLATAPTQIVGNGTLYKFTGWSDGIKTLSDVITVPSTPTTYTANFQCAQEWVFDKDLDTYYAGSPVVACQSPGTGYLQKGNLKPGDCDDNNAATHPGASEIADGLDNNCNGTIDEGVCIPAVKTKNITVQLTPGGNVIITPAQVDNGSVDACGGALTFNLDNATFYCENAGPNTVTLTATNANGVSSSATAIVTVEDHAAPTIITKNITAQLTPGGNVIISPADVNDGSYDACGNVTFSLDKTTFYCDNKGQNTVTLTGTDIYGNTAFATAVVTVEDNAKPTVITKNITAQIDAGGVAIIADRDVDNGSYDACGLVLYKLNQTRFDCSNIGPNTVILTVTDANGNTTSGIAIVTVEDPALPTVITKNITAQIDAGGVAIVADRDVDNGSFDACGLVLYSLSQTRFDCSNIGPNTVTLTVKDINGNTASGTAIVTVEDHTIPIVITKNITAQIDEGGVVIIGERDVDDGSYDPCGLVSYKLDKTRFDCSNVGANTVTLTVTDANGNIASGTAIVTVEDHTIPIVITKNITAQITAGGVAIIGDRDVDNGSYDPCGLVSYKLDKTKFFCNNIGPNTVTLTVTDANGNSASGTATVTVEDHALPTVITKNITVQLGADGTVTIADRSVDDGSYDACGLVLYKLDKTTFTCYNVGQNNVTLTVKDINGNVASGTAIVTVQGAAVATWVLDYDGDGYYINNPVTQCVAPAAGYVVKTTQVSGDCNDNDITVHAMQTYYRDADSDGFGNAAQPTTVCSSVPPAGYVANKTDCNDANVSINPLAVEVCGNGIDDNCNGLIDEAACSPCRNATGFSTTAITSTSAQLNWTATANPVQWQIQYKSTRPGTKWIDILLTGNLRTYKLIGLSAGPNYQWQIRAKCGNTWTSFTSSVSFKTASSSTSLLVKAAPDAIVEEGKAVISLHPNPTTGLFNLSLRQPNKLAITAVVNIRDISGRLIKTDRVAIIQGLLKTSMKLPTFASSGMYMVEVIVEKEVYTTRIVMIK